MILFQQIPSAKICINIMGCMCITTGLCFTNLSTSPVILLGDNTRSVRCQFSDGEPKVFAGGQKRLESRIIPSSHVRGTLEKMSGHQRPRDLVKVGSAPVVPPNSSCENSQCSVIVLGKGTTRLPPTVGAASATRPQTTMSAPFLSASAIPAPPR